MLFNVGVVRSSLSAPVCVKVSTPSLGVGYKIAMMAHQRCKPCLCLMYKGQEGDTKATTPLSAVLKGDRNLDVSVFIVLLRMACCTWRCVFGLLLEKICHVLNLCHSRETGIVDGWMPGVGCLAV